MKSTIPVAVTMLAVLALAGCETAAPYAPQDSPQSPGYSDRQLAENRYRVSFHGNSATSRETVEDYLLRHAAEVTLKAGYAYFVFDARDTKAKTRYYTDFAGWPGYGWYWHSWEFGGPAETYSSTRYTAYAEIVLLKDDQAKNEARAMKAQDVLDHLGPVPAPRT